MLKNAPLWLPKTVQSPVGIRCLASCLPGHWPSGVSLVPWFFLSSLVSTETTPCPQGSNHTVAQTIAFLLDETFHGQGKAITALTLYKSLCVAGAVPTVFMSVKRSTMWACNPTLIVCGRWNHASNSVKQPDVLLQQLSSKFQQQRSFSPHLVQ